MRGPRHDNPRPTDDNPRATDGHDGRLLENVRPAYWQNPQPDGPYDLVVIGAGTGGLVSAAIGAALGARVALVERDRMGGDCLNFGCVPSKAVLRAARSWAEARESAERFAGPVVAAAGNFAGAMERMRRIRADISAVDAATRFDSLGVDVYLGDARFDSRSSLRVDDGARLEFRRAIVATGARAAVPSIPGLDDTEYLTNETVFGLEELPDRLLVLGAGPIGCELAQAFARFGSEVTLLDKEPRVLMREEPDAATRVQEALQRDGVRFVGGARVVRVDQGPAGPAVAYEKDGEENTVETEALLLALGRTPNVDLGLEAAGVEYGREGVTTNDRLQTTNRRIFAVGDATSRLQFTHAADAQARLAVRNALFFGRGKKSDLVIPWATYTSPELARVGLTAEEAAEEGIEVDTVTVPLKEVDRAILDGDTDGFVRVHVRNGSDEIVGATIVAAHAGDLIAQVSQAMTLGIGLEKLSSVVFPYPTTAEVLRKAADARRRGKLTDRARRGFELFFRAWRRLP